MAIIASLPTDQRIAKRYDTFRISKDFMTKRLMHSSRQLGLTPKSRDTRKKPSLKHKLTRHSAQTNSRPSRKLGATEHLNDLSFSENSARVKTWLGPILSGDISSAFKSLSSVQNDAQKDEFTGTSTDDMIVRVNKE